MDLQQKIEKVVASWIPKKSKKYEPEYSGVIQMGWQTVDPEVNVRIIRQLGSEQAIMVPIETNIEFLPGGVQIPPIPEEEPAQNLPRRIETPIWPRTVYTHNSIAERLNSPVGFSSENREVNHYLDAALHAIKRVSLAQIEVTLDELDRIKKWSLGEPQSSLIENYKTMKILLKYGIENIEQARSFCYNHEVNLKAKELGQIVEKFFHQYLEDKEKKKGIISRIMKKFKKPKVDRIS